jgi:hypothetical protein
MVEQDVSYELALKLRDLESNQKLSKERLLLIGNNLIDSQEKNNSDFIEIKQTLQELKDDMKRVKSIIGSLSEEISKSARKEELTILEKQYKMFEPLNYVRIEDIGKHVDKKLLPHKSKSEEKKEEGFWSGKL